MNPFDSQEFIQDFLEEADQHLHNITSRLLKVEQGLTQSANQPPDEESLGEQKEQVDEIFRSFHTLKGLCGMVGLPTASELSHAMESLLRDIQRGELTFTQAIIDRLLAGSQTLAQIVETLRNPQAPLPDIQEHLQALALLRGKPTSSQFAPQMEEPQAEDFLLLFESTVEETPNREEPQKVHPAVVAPDIRNRAVPAEYLQAIQNELPKIRALQEKYQHVTLAIFTPSTELSEQGINVNLVRERLSGLGKLFKAAPLIEGRNIRFLFVLVTEKPINTQEFPWLEWYLMPRQEQEEEKAKSPSASAPPPAIEKTPASHPPETAGEPRSAAQRASTSMRVDISRMDELMRLIGELVVTRSRLANIMPKLEGAPPAAREALQETVAQIERQLRDLREAAMRMRMVPLGDVFGRMPLAVRDLAREMNKKVNLVTEGETTEIDKALVERLLDPLLHLVRNAITHGIETPEERLAAGKPETGVIGLKGYPRGDHIIIEVSDDGRGVDLQKVAQKARSLGWLTDESEITLDMALDFICRPGFSTRAEADMGAGRGVGMNVVREMVNSVGGNLSLRSTPGQGSAFILELPLTLTIIDALLISSGGERYAIPQSVISEVFEVEPASIVQVAGGREVIPFRGDSLALLRLNRLFGAPKTDPARRFHGLVVNQGTRRLALAVDRVEGLREVVAHTVSDPLIAQPGIGGVTELGDGSLILILDVPGLVRYALARAG
jgi:two-component system chemotaxis sensor kinase CheA